MPSLSSPIRIALVPLIAGLLVLSGCGSSHSASSSTAAGAPAPASTSTPSSPTSSSPTSTKSASAGPLCPDGETACVSQSTSAPVSGSKTLSTNLIRLLARSNPKLGQVQLACPQSTSYPVICELTGVDSTHGKPIKVKGQLTVAGVDTVTHTYAYSALYAPVKKT